HAGPLRREREPRLLSDGERVDVAPHCDHRRRPLATAESRYHAGVGDALECRRPQLPERLVQASRGFPLLEPELRLPVDGLTQCHQAAPYVCGDEAIGLEHLAVAGAGGEGRLASSPQTYRAAWWHCVRPSTGRRS